MPIRNSIYLIVWKYFSITSTTLLFVLKYIRLVDHSLLSFLLDWLKLFAVGHVTHFKSMPGVGTAVLNFLAVSTAVLPLNAFRCRRTGM